MYFLYMLSATSLTFETEATEFLEHAQSMLSKTLIVKSFNIYRKGYMQNNGLQMSCSPLSSRCINNRFLKVATEFLEHDRDDASTLSLFMTVRCKHFGPIHDSDDARILKLNFKTLLDLLSFCFRVDFMQHCISLIHFTKVSLFFN